MQPAGSGCSGHLAEVTAGTQEETTRGRMELSGALGEQRPGVKPHLQGYPPTHESCERQPRAQGNLTLLKETPPDTGNPSHSNPASQVELYLRSQLTLSGSGQK